MTEKSKVLLLNRGKRMFETSSGKLPSGGQLAVSEKEAEKLLVYKDIMKVEDYKEPENIRDLKAKLAKSEAEKKALKEDLKKAGVDPDKAEKEAKKAKSEAEKKAKEEAEKAKVTADKAKTTGGSGKSK